MAKFSKDEIQNMLKNTISSVLSDDESHSEVNENSDRISSVEKAVKSVAKQVQTLADLASNGFEKPKTVEDVVAEALKPIVKSIEEIGKKVNGDQPADEPIPQSKSDLQKMIAGILQDEIKKSLTPEKPKGKGKGKDNIEKTINNMTNDDAEELANELLEDNELNIETEDAAGNTLSKSQRVKRAELDNFFGKMLKSSAAAQGMAVTEEEEEEEEEEEDTEE